ncbi:acyltransferase family protein [Niabella soli]|uniref:Acyltransferase n=1 Tax=Niabella soli DSM 19437 TaxID=929713 RepID=W0EZY5_9BACT|nr:acyltransferase [Niabella soli]AHF14749.1 acyltransferase [Niabella soli DSM 19437]
MQNIVFNDTKKHYEILDGLRGVAALLVILMHVFEVFANGDHSKLIINHGYLAVDFFFMLSGFVIAHAYDDRWNKMTLKGFFKRRLIRLHPLILVGTTIGALLFYFQKSSMFPNIAGTGPGMFLLTIIAGYLMLPMPVSMDIRGWTETYPLDGPAWSLFFEYLANILYAIIIRRFSTKVLAVLVFIAAIILLQFALTSPTGDLVGGWALNEEQLRIGFTRLLFPFLAGLLLSRIIKIKKIAYGFLFSSLMLIVVLAMPRISANGPLWQNGLYEALSIILVFPLIVYIGACGTIKNATAKRFCSFLGDISYPLYITHYPLIYLSTAWVTNHKVPLSEAFPLCILIVFIAIGIAYLSLKYYDIPVRRWLSDRYMKTRK